MKPQKLGAVAALSLIPVLAACSPQSTSSVTPTQAPSTAAPATQTNQQMPAESETKTEMNIVETAQSVGTFTTLLAAAQAAGLAETLGTVEITVFAPTDAAFKKLPAGTVEGLLKKPDELAKILKYHVVSGKVPSSKVVSLSKATTLEGSDIIISNQGSKVMVNDATVTQADVMASNGIIHVIDTVLLPE